MLDVEILVLNDVDVLLVDSDILLEVDEVERLELVDDVDSEVDALVEDVDMELLVLEVDMDVLEVEIDIELDVELVDVEVVADISLRLSNMIPLVELNTVILWTLK